MVEILDAVDAALARGEGVLVHCWGGIGRTGTVIGCWLARHGHAVGEGVLGLLQWLRWNDLTADLPSPQTEVQREMVRTWGAGE